MTRYIVRRLLTMLVTMLVVSMVVFAIAEIAPGDAAKNILGPLATPAQLDSMRNQLGMDRPAWLRYVSWLFGSDWQASREIGRPLRRITVARGTRQNYQEWWAVDEAGRLVQWDVVGGQLLKLVRQADGSVTQIPDDGAWRTGSDGRQYFWGVDNLNRGVKWIKGEGGIEYTLSYIGWAEATDSPVDYIPLTAGLVRGDAGLSLRYGEPVANVISRRIANSAILAGLAMGFSIPLALVLGVLAGLNEGKWPDRLLSLGGLITTASPDFATGIFLIIVFGLWLKVLPGATVFLSDTAIFDDPRMLVLPVLTASLVETGYVLRITRASVTEVMRAAYVRTAILKGLTWPQVVLRHVLRNAMLAPVTVIMLHVNWFIGGLVVVESVFGFPGLGNLILNASLFRDVYTIEASAMVLIALAVGTQLVADIAYSYLNPRIRYA